LAAVTVERDSYRDLANSRWDGWVRGLWAISDLRDRLAEARDDCEKAQAGRIREAKRYDEMLKYACNLENKLGEMRVRIAGLTGALAIERDTLTQALAQRDAVAKRCKELRCKYRILYSHYLELPVAMASKYDELQCKLNMANATVKEQMDALAERDEDIADLRAVYSAMNEHHEAKLAELAAAKAPKRKSRK
jgi:chromosome segregation ATPase